MTPESVTLADLFALVSGFANTLTVVGVLLLIIVTALKQWWVAGWLYRQVKEERDMYRNMFMEQLKTGTDQAEQLERLADLIEHGHTKISKGGEA